MVISSRQKSGMRSIRRADALIQLKTTAVTVAKTISLVPVVAVTGAPGTSDVAETMVDTCLSTPL
jgi:hypothetical protein